MKLLKTLLIGTTANEKHIFVDLFTNSKVNEGDRFKAHFKRARVLRPGCDGLASIIESIPRSIPFGFLLTAETQYAVKVLADRTTKDCTHMNQKTIGIYHISRDVVENSLLQIADNPNVTGCNLSAISNIHPSDVLDMTDTVRAKLIERLKSHSET